MTGTTAVAVAIGSIVVRCYCCWQLNFDVSTTIDGVLQLILLLSFICSKLSYFRTKLTRDSSRCKLYA